MLGKKNLHLINDKTIQVDIYYMLKVLMDETDEKNNDFRHDYTNKVEELAACYRVKAGINTNMYVESFHKVLKYIY